MCLEELKHVWQMWSSFHDFGLALIFLHIAWRKELYAVCSFSTAWLASLYFLCCFYSIGCSIISITAEIVILFVCVSFTQPSWLTFICSNKTFSKSFCHFIFPAKCHRTVALHLCIIYFLAPIINVNTICTSCWSLSIPSFHLLYCLILFVFCLSKCVVLTASSLGNTLLVLKLACS